MLYKNFSQSAMASSSLLSLTKKKDQTGDSQEDQ
jgi:hypothetical protein